MGIFDHVVRNANEEVNKAISQNERRALEKKDPTKNTNPHPLT